MTRRHRDPLQRELEMAMSRFYELSAENQLRAYATMRDFLGSAVGETKLDRKLEERRLALEAIGQVAAKLKLPDGTAPTQVEFDAVVREVAPGWDSNRVRRAWGRWRFSTEVFLGMGLVPSAARQAIKRATIGRRRTHDEYVVAVRRWLETKPAHETHRTYDRWRREWNENLPEGELPAPS